MTVPEVIFAALRGLVADRVYPAQFPQGEALPVWPSIRYTRVSSDTFATLCGTGDESEDDQVYQLDIVAETWDNMRALSAQVITALAETDPPCYRQSYSETFDSETRTHRAVMDFRFQPSSEPG